MSESLYQQLAATIGVGDSVIIPQVIEMLADEKEAAMLMAASPPGTVEELAERTGIDAGEIEAMTGPLFKKGLLFKSHKPEGTKYYRFRQLLQFHDATILAPDMPPEFLELWRKYQREEFLHHHKRIEAQLPRSATRVIPVNIALQPDAQVAAFDDVAKMIEESRALAVVDCTCRLVDGDCGLPLEVCIQVNKAADYTLERGTGRSLTKEEAIDMLKMCEEEGLVHTVGNSRALGHVICNCCKDCCINWPGPRTSPVNFTAPSRFTAVVDADECTSCEVCLDRCYFEAITMTGEGDTALINEANCMGCGLCAVTCADEAISMQELRSEDFVPVQ